MFAFLMPVSFFFSSQHGRLLAATVAVVQYSLRLVIFLTYHVAVCSRQLFSSSYFLHIQPMLGFGSILFCVRMCTMAYSCMAKINYTLKLKFFRTNSDLLSLLLQSLSLFTYLNRVACASSLSLCGCEYSFCSASKLFCVTHIYWKKMHFPLP